MNKSLLNLVLISSIVAPTLNGVPLRKNTSIVEKLKKSESAHALAGVLLGGGSGYITHQIFLRRNMPLVYLCALFGVTLTAMHAAQKDLNIESNDTFIWSSIFSFVSSLGLARYSGR